MAFTTVYDGIIFIEGSHPNAIIKGDIKVDLGSNFGAQLKNLSDVKKQLALKVKSNGGNCLLEFKYGQKSRWFAIDDVAFWGSGKVATLPEEIYIELL